MIQQVSLFDIWPYFLIMVFFLSRSSIQSSIESEKKNENSCFIILFLLSIFRYNIGADYPAYWQFAQTGERDNYEFLSQIIIDISYKLKFPPLLFIIYSTITLFSLRYFINRLSANRILSWYLYFCFPLFCFQDYSTVRQAASIGLFLVGSIFLFDKKYLYALCAILISAQFHVSAYIGILAFLMPIIRKMSKSINIILFILSFITGQLVVRSFLTVFDGFFIAEKFMNYISYDFAKTNTLQYLIYMMVFINLYFYDKLVQLDKRNVIYIGFVTIGACLFNLFQIESQTARRLATYFLLFELLIIPYIASALSPFFKNYKTSTQFIIILLFILQVYYINLYINGFNNHQISSPCFVPYDFWWNHL